MIEINRMEVLLLEQKYILKRLIKVLTKNEVPVLDGVFNALQPFLDTFVLLTVYVKSLLIPKNYCLIDI